MSVPASCAVGLRCIDCATEHPLTYLLACRSCRGLLEPVYDLAPLRRLGHGAAFSGRGVWRYHPVLPIRTVAEGLAVGDPGAKGAWVLRILRESNGLATDVDDEPILETQRLLARTEGLYAGPTGVGALAAVRRLLTEGRLDPDQSICCVVTETGLKTEAVATDRTGEAFTYERLVDLVRERLGL